MIDQGASQLRELSRLIRSNRCRLIFSHSFGIRKESFDSLKKDLETAETCFVWWKNSDEKSDLISKWREIIVS